MGIILKPNIIVDDIHVEMDKNSPDGAKKIMAEWGRNIPIVKIGDYVLGMGDLREFSLKVALNSLPSFSMVVNDEQYKIREALKNSIDKCIIFVGYKDWYIKFNGILNKTYSSLGDSMIRLSGNYYNEKLFEGQQFSYKDKSITDILKNICEKTNMGLFTYSNPDLTKVVDYSLMTGTRYIDYFDFLIRTYTNNLFSIDCHSFFHVGDVDTLRKQPYDKYSLDWSTGKPFEKEQDIIFKSIVRDADPIKIDYKIPIKYYSLNTNFSEIFQSTYKSYSIGFGGNGEEIIQSNDTIGIGSNKTNSFFGFKTHKIPYYNDRINKNIGGNSIKISTNNIIFELSPLSIVGFEMYLPFTSGENIRLDTEHSGKKIVISSTIGYKKTSDDLNQLTQIIELI